MAFAKFGHTGFSKDLMIIAAISCAFLPYGH